MRTSLRIRADAERIDWIEAKQASVQPRQLADMHMTVVWHVSWTEGAAYVTSTGKSWREAVDLGRGYGQRLNHEHRAIP